MQPVKGMTVQNERPAEQLLRRGAADLTATWRIWLPSAVVIFSLVALLVVPLVLEARVRDQRRVLADVVQPARTDLGRVQLALARQSSALRSYLLSGDARHLHFFHTLRREEEQKLAQMEELLEPLGPGYAPLAASLRRSAAELHEQQLRLLEQAAFGRSEVEDLARYRSHEHVLAAAHELDLRLFALAQERRQRVERLDRGSSMLTGALAMLAAVSALLVAGAAQRFRHRAEEEHALGEAAFVLTEAVSVGDVLRRAADTAARLYPRGGAYVERIVDDGHIVEIVAVAGTLAPALATRWSYAQSLARINTMSDCGEVAVADSAALPRALVERGARAALTLRLRAEPSFAGALVLVRRREQRAFPRSDRAQLRILAALVELALRKAVLLEQAEARHEALRRATESRARLLRGFSHDAKNPLGAADAYAALLEEGVLTTTEEQQDAVGHIRRSISTALELINNLVELGRVEAGQIEVRREQVDIAALAAAVVEDFRAAAESAGLRIDREIDGRLPPVQTDPARVRQILANLLSNAIKYTPAGGRVVLKVETGAGQERQPTVKLAVSDTGPGIPADKRQLLFEEFARLNPGNAPGTGLGLAISDRIAALLGGELAVESTVGSGSTFILRLPARAQQLH